MSNPVTPTGIVMPHTAELVFTALGVVPLIAVAILALQHLRDGRGPLLLCCLLGGLSTCLFEPFVDVLGLVYLPEHGALLGGTFTLYGRTMPLFVPLMYPWYMGGLAYLTCRRLERGATVRDVFVMLIGFAVVNFVLEAPGLVTNVYTYYGNQPWNLWGQPMWWGPAEAFTALTAGTLVFGFKRFLGSGWGLLGVTPLIFVSEGLANGGCGFPMYAALHANLGYAWTYPISLVTFGLIGLGTYLIGRLAEALAPARQPDEPSRIGTARPARSRRPALTGRRTPGPAWSSRP